MQISDQEIFQAIEQHQFTPYFQPVVDLRSSEVHSFEVLARWQHPTLGLINPNQFISRAERRGLMNTLGMSLFRQAFVAARSIASHIGLSVNLSPAQLRDPALPDLLERLADQERFDLKRLTVEITETALLGETEIAAVTAADLKALGVRLSMDDFGTGYSSLLHLQTLPFDEIKVDVSFVRSMVNSLQSRKITAAVISLARSLGLSTVAEGIEDTSQANLLLWQGCSLGQGWLYGYPQPAEKLAEMLAQRRTQAPPVPSLVADLYVALDAHPTERLSQLQAIYDSAPVGLCFLDSQLRYVKLNQRLADMNGKPVEAFLGMKAADVLPHIYVQVQDHLKRALEGIACAQVALKLPPMKLGAESMTRLASFQPVRDDVGTVIGVCVSIQDVPVSAYGQEVLRHSAHYFRNGMDEFDKEQRPAEQLGRVEASLSALVDTAPVGILFADATTGIILKANARAEQIAGRSLTPDVLWTEAAAEATDVHGCSLDPLDRPLARALHLGETTSGQEIVLRRPDGSRIWLSISAAPVRSPQGELIGGLLTMQELENINQARQKMLQMPILPATARRSLPAADASSR